MTTADPQTDDMVSGDDQTIRITVTDADGTAADLSGSTLTFVLANTSGETLVEKTSGGGAITVTGSDNDVAEVQLDSADTADLEGRFKMELEEETNGGQTNTLLQGILTIHEDIIT